MLAIDENFGDVMVEEVRGKRTIRETLGEKLLQPRATMNRLAVVKNAVRRSVPLYTDERAVMSMGDPLTLRVWNRLEKA